MLGDIMFKRIDEEKDDLIKLARKIWENPEKGNYEFIASDACTELLEKKGFQVERDYGGLPTALRAQYGSGHPVIGLLGEFDALPGLSLIHIFHAIIPGIAITMVVLSFSLVGDGLRDALDPKLKNS